MAEESSSYWQDQVGSDRSAFVCAIEAAKKLPGMMMSVFDIIPVSAMSQLRAEYQKLNGETSSSGGFFAALDNMKPEMIGSKEAEWFKQIPPFCRKVKNALVGKPLEDTAPWTQSDLVKAMMVRQELSALNEISSDINLAFSPPDIAAAP